MILYRFLLILVFIFSNIYSKPITLFVYGPTISKANRQKKIIYKKRFIGRVVKTLSDNISFIFMPEINGKVLEKDEIDLLYTKNYELFYSKLYKLIKSLYKKSNEKINIISFGQASSIVKKLVVEFESDNKYLVGSIIFVDSNIKKRSYLDLNRKARTILVDDSGELELVDIDLSNNKTRLEMLDIDSGDLGDDELFENDSIVILNSSDIKKNNYNFEESSCCSIWFTPKRVDSVIKLSTILLRVIELLLA